MPSCPSPWQPLCNAQSRYGIQIRPAASGERRGSHCVLDRHFCRSCAVRRCLLPAGDPGLGPQHQHQHRGLQGLLRPGQPHLHQYAHGWQRYHCNHLQLDHWGHLLLHGHSLRHRQSGKRLLERSRLHKYSPGAAHHRADFAGQQLGLHGARHPQPRCRRDRQRPHHHQSPVLQRHHLAGRGHHRPLRLHLEQCRRRQLQPDRAGGV